MKLSRQEVYEVIDGERDYQEAQKGNSARHETFDPKVMHPAEGLLYIEKCLNDAREAAYKGVTGSQDCLVFVRKIAALAVRIMEEHGAPRR